MHARHVRARPLLREDDAHDSSDNGPASTLPAKQDDNDTVFAGAGHKKHLKDKVRRSKSFLFSCRVKCQECMGTTYDRNKKKYFRRQFLLFLQ